MDTQLVGVTVDREDWVSRGMLAFGKVLGRYHRHDVVDLDRLGDVLARGRRVILVANHALNVVDPLLFVSRVLAAYGVVPRFMGHAAWFSTPVVRAVAERYRIIPSRSMEAASDALREDGLLMLFPGAVREAAVRNYATQPYRLLWEDRTGFVRLALEHDADIMFVGAVGNDEAYYQSRFAIPNSLVRYLANGDASRYRGASMSFGLLGPHLLPGLFPLPVRMTHFVSEPIDLGDRDAALADPDAFAELHARVWGECQQFLDDAIDRRDEHSDLADQALRSGQALLHELGV